MHVDRVSCNLEQFLGLFSFTGAWKDKLSSILSSDDHFNYHSVISFLIRNAEGMEDTFDKEEPFTQYSSLYEIERGAVLVEETQCNSLLLTCYRIFYHKSFANKTDRFLSSAAAQLAIYYAKATVPSLLSLAFSTLPRRFPCLLQCDVVYSALKQFFGFKCDSNHWISVMQKKLKGHLSALIGADVEFAIQMLEIAMRELKRASKPFYYDHRMFHQSGNCLLVCPALFPTPLLFSCVFEGVSMHRPTELLYSETFWECAFKLLEVSMVCFDSALLLRQLFD